MEFPQLRRASCKPRVPTYPLTAKVFASELGDGVAQTLRRHYSYVVIRFPRLLYNLARLSKTAQPDHKTSPHPLRRLGEILPTCSHFRDRPQRRQDWERSGSEGGSFWGQLVRSDHE